MSRQMVLNGFMMSTGHHQASWRLPESNPTVNREVSHYQGLARIAERGRLDSVSFADSPAIMPDPARRPSEVLDPVVLLSAMAVATQRIGLVATASTTYEAPYNLARRFATLDAISHGRAGWNVVTSSDRDAEANFGVVDAPTYAARYRRAKEFLEVVLGLWGGWEADAIVADRGSGVFADPAKVHALDHVGNHFRVRGPLNVGRSEQGWPVVVQSDSSIPGIALAASYAEIVFTAQQTVEEGRAFFAELKAETQRVGRNPDHLKILQGIMPIIGGTQAEARAIERRLDDLVVFDHPLRQLAGDVGIPADQIDLDAPLPENIRPISEVEGNKARYGLTVELARRENLTVRQLLLRVGRGRGHRTLVGTPEQVADAMEEWFTMEAADGFNVMPAVLPSGLEAFVDHVVPLLQKRGLARREYAGATLRDHYGLPGPASPPRSAALEDAG